MWRREARRRESGVTSPRLDAVELLTVLESLEVELLVPVFDWYTFRATIVIEHKFGRMSLSLVAEGDSFNERDNVLHHLLHRSRGETVTALIGGTREWPAMGRVFCF